MKIFLSIDFYVQIIFILAVCIMEVAAAGVMYLRQIYSAFSKGHITRLCNKFPRKEKR